MKNLYVTGFILASILRPATGHAQQPVPLQQKLADKPQLFSQLPEKSECRITDFASFFQLHANDQINITLNNQLTITGQVMEKVQVNPYVVTLNISSSNFPGALLSLSQFTQPGQPVKYSGMIIHPQKGDVLRITEENNRYMLQKQSQKFFMTE